MPKNAENQINHQRYNIDKKHFKSKKLDRLINDYIIKFYIVSVVSH